MLDVLNSSLLGLMISIGHQTHLFDIMSRLSSPSTSAKIAKAANLDERYVREWLGAMVTGKIVEYNPATSKYRLPPENALLFLQRMQGLIIWPSLCSTYHC
jgi:DNA-binding IclR family transcriptional regulator